MPIKCLSSVSISGDDPNDGESCHQRCFFVHHPPPFGHNMLHAIKQHPSIYLHRSRHAQIDVYRVLRVLQHGMVWFFFIRRISRSFLSTVFNTASSAAPQIRWDEWHMKGKRSGDVDKRQGFRREAWIRDERQGLGMQYETQGQGWNQRQGWLGARDMGKRQVCGW